MPDSSNLLAQAEDVAKILLEFHLDALVIGGVALAAHQYIRFTDDIDMGVNADLSTLGKVGEALARAGYDIELRQPDANDPLGGVLDVRGTAGLVQIVNFGDRFPAVIEDALAQATLFAQAGSLLKIVPLPHLIALKLYAGGFKSKADIIELLQRNQDADREEIRRLCERYRLKGFDSLLAELG